MFSEKAEDAGHSAHHGMGSQRVQRKQCGGEQNIIRFRIRRKKAQCESSVRMESDRRN